MAQNIVTNANDVELVLERADSQRGTPQDLGRVVVDDFSITKEEDAESVSGVGWHLPVGLTRGDISFSFSFTILGEDVSTFEMIADSRGRGNLFSFTARKADDDGTLRWEYALDTCLATSEENSGTSGDPTEYAVEGIAVRLDKTGTREDGKKAWG